MNRRFLRSKFLLILLGVGLGLSARFVLGDPESNSKSEYRFHNPLPDSSDSLPHRSDWPGTRIQPNIDLPIIREGAGGDRDEGADDGTGLVPPGTGLVPPIKIPGLVSAHSASHWPAQTAAILSDPFDRFSHDESAVFEAHGHQVCASGCAASRHPTTKLTKRRFQRLISQYAKQPMDESSPALEQLLFFGPQTVKLIESAGLGSLDPERTEFLCRQLQRTHALVSIRVIDQYGEVRTWLSKSRVPLDRRHVFEMKTNKLQPLVTSGTVKRVGLDHLWTRL